MINGNAIDHWPVIGEFAYLKMIATLTLKRLNVARMERDLAPVAQGPIKHELENIKYSCLVQFDVQVNWVISIIL